MLWKIRFELIPGVNLLLSVTKWVPLTSTPTGFLSRNCDWCSPYEELQHHLACYLKKKRSDNSYCCCWYCYCKRNMVEAQRIYSRVGLQLEWGIETWRSIERVLPGGDWGNHWNGICCTRIHFTFEETSPTCLFISIFLLVMSLFWLLLQGLSLQISRWLWFIFSRIQHLSMCSKSHAKITHCSEFSPCCLIHCWGRDLINVCLLEWMH